MLKQHTAEIHARVESGTGLADPTLDRARLRAVIARFATFWAGTEPLLDEWAGRHPAAADRLQWARRRRTDRLARDLARLGGPLGAAPSDVPPSVEPATAPAPAPPVFAVVDEAAVFGWLYVAEGSSLGGAVIDRALRRGGEYLALETFTPYAEGPGPMWREYLAALAAFADGDELRAAAVVTAGERVFTALEAWLSPLTREQAA